jgi:CDP-diacylglycerol--serine O-phosphatidyltransferase
MRLSRAFIPNMITSAAIVVGYAAIMLALEGHYVVSAWLLLLIALLDSLDGRVARALNATSDFGAQFDSLADVLNFGIVLSIVLYMAFFSDWGVMGMALSFLPTLFSALRLARFNVDNTDTASKPPYFTGLPTTLSAILLASFVIFAAETWADYGPTFLPVLLVLLSSFLMVSEVPYATNATLLSGITRKQHKQVVAAVLMLSLVLFPSKALFIATIIFVLYGCVRSLFETIADRRPV